MMVKLRAHACDLVALLCAHTCDLIALLRAHACDLAAFSYELMKTAWKD